MRAIGTSSPPPHTRIERRTPWNVVKLQLEEGGLQRQGQGLDHRPSRRRASWIDVKIVELPLKEGAKVFMALWLATREWRADVTRSLLMKDADTNKAWSDCNEVGRGG